MRPGLTVLAAVAVTGVCHAQPCTPAPCNGADACRRTADWVVVGTVLEYSEGGTAQSCRTTFPFLREKCSFAILPPTVSLYAAEQVRGRSDLVKHGVADLPRAATCSTGSPSPAAAPSNATPYPNPMIAGQQYRFYGFDPRPGQPGGFVLAEPADELGQGG